MLFSNDLVSHLQSGNLAVIPTDTLYGIVCRAANKDAVEKLYTVRGRDTAKPCIILIDRISRLAEFGIVLSKSDEASLGAVWPGKVSVVFDCPSEEWAYLHRGSKTLAFRIPDDENLRVLLEKTGSLLAPSANKEGMPPARTIEEAENYFSPDRILFIDGGRLESLPSTVARLQSGEWQILREGAVRLAPSPIMEDLSVTHNVRLSRKKK